MSTTSKKEERRRKGLARMARWWEFWDSPEVRSVSIDYQARIHRAYAEWYARKYPVEAAIEASERNGRLDKLVELLLKPSDRGGPSR